MTLAPAPVLAPQTAEAEAPPSLALNRIDHAARVAAETRADRVAQWKARKLRETRNSATKETHP